MTARSETVTRAVAFDTHAFVKKLRGVGFSEEQAEVQVEALASLIDERLATRDDLERLRIELKRDLRELEMRLLIRLGALLAVATGVVATLVEIL